MSKVDEMKKYLESLKYSGIGDMAFGLFILILGVYLLGHLQATAAYSPALSQFLTGAMYMVYAFLFIGIAIILIGVEMWYYSSKMKALLSEFERTKTASH
jgi:Na+/phosphate symporter